MRWTGIFFITACFVMLALEAWIFLNRSDDQDLNVYHSYGQYSNIEGASLDDVYSDNMVEYPPLAVALMLGTDAVAQRLPVWHGLPEKTYDPDEDLESFTKFKVFYRLEMAAVLFGTFLLLCRIWKTYMQREILVEWMERLAVFFIGLGLLSQLAFDRLDAVMGALLLLAVALMLGRRHYAWSFFTLAVAIAFKFVPVVLAPLWIIGALPAGMIAARRTPGGMRRLFLAMTGRGMLLGAFTILLYLPFVIFGGSESLEFLSYHSQRGIEFGSTYAALMGVLKYITGLEISASDGFGSHNIVSSLSPLLTRLAPAIMLGLLVAATILLLANMMRACDQCAPAPGTTGMRAGRACGRKFMQHTMLLLLIFIFANKVFSPQYLLWILPLAAVMPLPRGRRGLFHAGFLALCLLTLLIYPCFLDDTLGRQISTGPDHPLFSGPTRFGVMLLAGRALLMAGMIAGLSAHLVRRLRPVAELVPGDQDREEIGGLLVDQSPVL